MSSADVKLKPAGAATVHPSGDNRFKILEATMKRNQYQPDALIEALHKAQGRSQTMQRGTLITFLNKLANPTLKLILHSPLHGLVSRSIMLITYTGRRSGKTYTTPVNYVRDGDTFFIVSTADRTWWRNLRGGAPVILQMQRHTLQGYGQCVEELQDVAKELRTLMQLSPGARKMYHASDGQPEDLKRIAAGRVVVRVTARAAEPIAHNGSEIDGERGQQ